MSDLSRKMFLAETAAVREHLAEQEQQATAEPAGRAEWDALVRDADQLRRAGAQLHDRAEHIDAELKQLRTEVEQWRATFGRDALPGTLRRLERAEADRATVLREAALHLYTALFPAVYDDMGQKAAEGVNRAVSELRRMADETATAETPAVPVQHAPGEVICCPDCRAKGYTVCLDEPAAGARQSDDPDRIVAYRSLGGRILRCLNHIPPEPEGDFVPVTAEDLPDGGICTYPTPAGSLSLRCGVDVLIPQPAAGARQDGTTQ